MRPLILVALLLSIACAGRPPSEDDTTGEGEGEDLPPMPTLPERLRIQGDASGTVDGETATCTFFADLGEVRAPEDGSVGFDAFILGGEVFRRVEPADGKGTGAEFQALIGGPVTLRRTADGDLLRFVGDQTDAPRFWRALEVLTTEHAIDEASWSDTWSCEPIDVDEPGFVDNTTTVEGTWSMAPLPSSKERRGLRANLQQAQQDVKTTDSERRDAADVPWPGPTEITGSSGRPRGG